ncbi:hypothetical protein Tco_0941294 [Tanacetum coccineum]|uniref:Uncharacterized protein n=1 Tax=Tanacetum coccineum TaxID=301880 RepID=A0ABQ5DWF1_9ASTR
MMGKISFFIGLQISQSLGGIFINQSKYASEIVKKYGLHTTDSVDTPLVEKSKLDEIYYKTHKNTGRNKLLLTPFLGMIGFTLMYLNISRTDISMAVCLCATVSDKAYTKKLVQAVKWFFRYLKGNINMGLVFGDQKLHSLVFQEAKVHGHLGYRVLNLLPYLGCCAQNPMDAFTANDYGFLFNRFLFYILRTNKSVIALCCNNVQPSRAKHIDVRYHSIKEHVENGIVELYFIQTEYQLVDIFTKPLPRERFNFLIEKLGMKSMSPETLKRLVEETDE